MCSIKKCVSISILDFILFEIEGGFYSSFHILEDTRHFPFSDKMEFHVIELPKLPLGLRDGCSQIELWAKFINAENKEEFDMIAEKDPFINSAYRQLQAISQDRQKRLEYEASSIMLKNNRLLTKNATLCVVKTKSCKLVTCLLFSSLPIYNF